MWRNFRFLLICHVQKFEISPHDRFFLHGHRPCVRDKYQVCWQDPSISFVATLSLSLLCPYLVILSLLSLSLCPYLVILPILFLSRQLTLFSRIAITLLAVDMLPYLWENQHLNMHINKVNTLRGSPQSLSYCKCVIKSMSLLPIHLGISDHCTVPVVLWRLWLLVVTEQGTNQGTMSPIELSGDS